MLIVTQYFQWSFNEWSMSILEGEGGGSEKNGPFHLLATLNFIYGPLQYGTIMIYHGLLLFRNNFLSIDFFTALQRNCPKKVGNHDRTNTCRTSQIIWFIERLYMKLCMRNWSGLIGIERHFLINVMILIGIGHWSRGSYKLGFKNLRGLSLIIRVWGSLESGKVSPANLWPPLSPIER